jgi:hypothetical protein
VAIQPVIENLAAVSRREREQAALMARRRLGEDEGKSVFGVSRIAFTNALPFLGFDSNTSAANLVSPFTLMTPSPPPDRQFDTNPSTGLNRRDSATAAGPSDLVTAVNFRASGSGFDWGYRAHRQLFCSVPSGCIIRSAALPVASDR